MSFRPHSEEDALRSVVKRIALVTQNDLGGIDAIEGKKLFHDLRAFPDISSRLVSWFTNVFDTIRMDIKVDACLAKAILFSAPKTRNLRVIEFPPKV